ncbi:MAG: hypothetical protein AAGF92_01415 [Myxococcota bacterium]
MKWLRYMLVGGVLLGAVYLVQEWQSGWTTCYILCVGNYIYSSNSETVEYRLTGPRTVQYRWLNFDDCTDPPTMIRHEAVFVILPANVSSARRTCNRYESLMSCPPRRHRPDSEPRWRGTTSPALGNRAHPR